MVDHSLHAGRVGALRGWHPAMVGTVPLVMKDVVLLAVLVCPRRKDASR
jgi:hypothetical protein